MSIGAIVAAAATIVLARQMETSGGVPGLDDHVVQGGPGPAPRLGPPCRCTHIPACRHDHHTKQVPGWTVTTPRPGTLSWTTPGQRTHTTTPAQYWE